MWIGSTEEEYFSVSFVKGVLGISLEEREMLLGKNPINYAMVSELMNKLSKVKNNREKSLDVARKYNKVGYIKDLEEIGFEDVMKVLKWKKFSPKIKVKPGILFGFMEDR